MNPQPEVHIRANGCALHVCGPGAGGRPSRSAFAGLRLTSPLHPGKHRRRFKMAMALPPPRASRLRHQHDALIDVMLVLLIIFSYRCPRRRTR